MKLISVKRPKEKTKDVPEIATSEGENYPYGLRLNFEKVDIDKIKTLQSIQAGAEVSIQGIGKVIEVRITDADKGRKRHNVEIQIQQINVDDKNSFDDAFDEATKKK